MPKIYLDRLKARHGFHGETYNALIGKIIANNRDMITRRMTELSQDQWNHALSKITPKNKTYVIPSLDEVLPKRSVFLLKGVEQGKLISDTLRNELTTNLRASLNQFTPKTKEQTYLYRRGKRTGQINPKLINQFQRAVRDTFKNYTRIDPSVGMPSNIHNIAVTEMRSAIGMIKREFANILLQKNPDVQLKKTWIHNRRLSVNPRPGHRELNQKTIPYDEVFSIPIMKRKNGQWAVIGFVNADGPHDPSLPPSEIIGCNCDKVFQARRK